LGPPERRRNRWGAGLRGLGLLLRSGHLVAVSALAVVLHAQPEHRAVAAAALLLTGLALLALELADHRVALNEAAGAVVLGKLVAAGVMAWQPAWAAWIFWPLLFLSSLASHAPRRWRHWPTRLD
jgi:hypothetical protein